MNKTPVNYDPEVVQAFAKQLYREASSVAFTDAVFGLLIGGTIGATFISMSPSSHIDLRLGLAVGGLIGAVIGYSRGSARAFNLRLQAQLALCQVQIEKNTSRT
jgi:hypothetical protein